ncbi:hypothetical protein MRX96_017533 [Rhipicephalus microplus]
MALDGEWDEIKCVYAYDTKVVDDLNGAAGAVDEKAIAEDSNNVAEKSEENESIVTTSDNPKRPTRSYGWTALDCSDVGYAWFTVTGAITSTNTRSSPKEHKKAN